MGEVLSGRRKQSILVVDDHRLNAELLRELLATRGYQASIVSSAADAEDQIRRDPPDLILLDVVMPGKSGYELCHELKDDPATRLIPIVMITGLDAHEDRLRAIGAGADDFLTKPISAEELFARVKSLLKLKEFTDELETAESVLCTLGLSVEARDPYTEGHCERLARDASELGRYLGLDDDCVVALRRGGYLHDLGKIKVPDEILKKGSNLTPEEWKIMKQHPVVGRGDLPPAEIAAAGAAHYSPSSRAFGWQRLSRRPEGWRDPAPATRSAGRRHLRRAAHGSSLQEGPPARASLSHHARRSRSRSLG
jgi:response regulator RpfG family c-di-GMP phosphodiesterase